MSKGKKAAKGTPENLNWDEGLINEVVEIDSWRPYLVFLAADHALLQPHLEALMGVADGGNRRRFIVIDREAMLQTARDDAKLAAASAGGGGGGKKSKLSSATPAARPLHVEVCEHVVNALNSGGEVPPALVAKMLKYSVLKKRTLDIARQEALRKEAEDASKPPSQSTGGKKGAGSGRASKVAGGKKGGKETPAVDAAPAVPIPQKAPTTMKKRGEEDLDSKYIDDEPSSGPDRYFLLTGFTSSELLKQLTSVKLSAHALVKVVSEEAVESGTLTEEEQAELHQQENVLTTFWLHVCHVIKATPSGSMLRDMALLDLTLVQSIVPTSDEEKAAYGQTLFDALAQKIYVTVEKYVQYQHYLRYLDVQPLPPGLYDPPSRGGKDSEGSGLLGSARPLSCLSSTEVAGRVSSVDMRYYRELLSAVPEESCSVPLVLHCMVEQVSASLSGTSPIQVSQRPVNGTHPDIMAEINSTVAALALPTTEKQEVFTNNGRVKSSSNTKVSSTVMVPHQNSSKERTFHLRDSKFLKTSEVETTFSRLSPIADILTHPDIPQQEKNKQKAQIHAVEHFCISDKLSSRSLNYALVLLSLEHFQLTCASKPPSLGTSRFPSGLLFDFPFDFSVCEGGEGHSRAVVPCSSPGDSGPQAPSGPGPSWAESEYQGILQLPKPLTTLTDYSVCESLNKDTLLQLIHGLQHSTHPYIETFYHGQGRSVVVVLHTGFDGNPIHTYKWLSQAHSPVGFQNYLQYVAEEFGQAINKAVHEDSLRRVEFEEQRKLKAEERQTSQETVQVAKEEDKTPSAKGSKKGSAASSAKKTPIGGKKSKLGSKEATPAVSTHDILSPVEQGLPEFKEQKLFTAYDVGDTVLLTQGQHTTQYTADGAQIRTEKYEFAEGQISTNVSLHIDGHSLSISLTSAQTKVAEKEAETDQATSSGGEAPNEQVGEEVKCEEVPKPTAGIPQPPDHTANASFQASFENGLILSLSHYGSAGNGELPFEPEKPEILLQAVSRPTSSADSRSQSRQGGSPQKMSKKQQEQQQQLLEQQKLLEEQQAKERKTAEEKYEMQRKSLMRHNKYQQLFASTQYGLHVHCQVMVDLEADPSLTDGSDGFIVVRQCYPVQSSGTQDCEEILSQTAFKEKSRCYLPDGSVVKYMHDSSVVIQCADGSVYRTALPAQAESYKAAFPQTKESQEDPATEKVSETIERATSTIRVTFADEIGKDEANGLPSDINHLVWVVTTPSGTQYLWKNEDKAPSDQEQDSEVDNPPNEMEDEANSDRSVVKSADDQGEGERIISLSNIECYPATDPITKEVLITREDNVAILHRPNGTQITEYADGTRFTTHRSNRKSTQPTEIVIECPGFARVSFLSSNHHCQVVFPDSSCMECSPNGSYTVTKPSDYTLHLLASGEARYTAVSRPDSRSATYSLDHTGSGNLFEVSDYMGNKFCVTPEGKATVDSRKTDSKLPPHPAFSPRYFTIEEDGSCYELLRKETADAAIAALEEHPRAIVLRDALSTEPGSSSTTVMEPCDAGNKASCVVPFLEESIVPVNLQYREAYHQASVHTPGEGLGRGKRFGVGVGKALMIGSYKKPPVPKPFSPPAALRYRQFIYLNPVDNTMRNHIYSCLSNYISWRIQQETEGDTLLPSDERTDTEKVAAKKLESTWKEATGKANTTDSDLLVKYIQGVTKPPTQQDANHSGNDQKKRELHEAIVKEREETEMIKQALREHQVPPYFESEEYRQVKSPDMEGLSKRLAKHVGKPSPEELPDTEQQLLSGRSTPSTLHSTSMTRVSVLEPESPVPSEAAGQLGPVSSLSKIRPSNPTPDHAHGNGTPTELRPTNPTPCHAVVNNTSPSNVEGSLPVPTSKADTNSQVKTEADNTGMFASTGVKTSTPLQAYTQGSTDTTTVSFASPLLEIKIEQDDSLAIATEVDGSIPEDTKLDTSSRYKSTLVDVTGEPRQAPVKSPGSIQGGRPGEKPNTKFATIEEPVRRKVHTSSTTAAIGRIVQGFEVLPERVKFGVLKEGCTYAYTVTLKNVGFDSCRFRIKQPPPSTGIKVIYTPGAVAAGMSRDFDVEIFAIAVGVVGEHGEGAIRHDLEIVTETSTLYLPIEATVETTFAYVRHQDAHPQSSPRVAAGVRLVADRPLSQESVTRPPKPL